MSETDEISQALSGAATTAVSSTAYVAQTVMQKARAVTLERARQVQEEARAAQERLAAERQSARAVLAVVDQPTWWQGATPRNAIDLADLAAAWAPHDEHAARYGRTIEEGARNRWGASVDELRARPEAGVAEGERSAASLDVADAQSLAAAADALERQAEDVGDENAAVAALDEAAADHAEAGAAWDSAERRQDLAASLGRIDNRAAVDARLTADLDQATPPVAAAAAGRAASRAGKAKGRARTRTAHQRSAERGR
jgi:colicin import membrane protein